MSVVVAMMMVVVVVTAITQRVRSRRKGKTKGRKMHEGKPSVKPPNRENPANRLCSAPMDHISVAQTLLPFFFRWRQISF